MGRPKKTKINLDKNSLQEFMQEIYNDCVNIMNSARKELNERKTRAEIDDVNDESLIGKVNNETLKIIDSTIDKKLALAKLQSQIVATSNNENDKIEPNTLSEEDKGTLRDLFNQKNDATNREYDLD
jgi:signal-transduction protein with cAMP-binding, CBS, and nucleotidyltransferase domain